METVIGMALLIEALALFLVSLVFSWALPHDESPVYRRITWACMTATSIGSAVIAYIAYRILSLG